MTPSRRTTRATLADIAGAIVYAAFVAVVIAGMGLLQMLLDGVPQ